MMTQSCSQNITNTEKGINSMCPLKKDSDVVL